MYFKDSEALGLESEAHAAEIGADHAYTPLEDGSEDEEIETDISIGSATDLKPTESSMFWVPLLIGVSDIIIGIASGMTIKFFPLFFKGEQTC